MTHLAERDLAQPKSSPPGLGAVVRLGIGCGLFLGLGEGGLVLLRRILRPKLLFLGPDYYWMAPVAEAMLFAGIALLLAGAGRAFPWLKSWSGVVTVYLFLALLTILFSEIHGLHPAAISLIALGLASQLGPRIVRWVPRLPVLVGRSVPALVLVVILVGAGIRGSRWWREHRAATARPEAARDAPNVLLLILDTVRAADLSLYGYGRSTTPNLQRWARQGVRFAHTISTSSWTLASHASMFTGRLPHETSAGWLTPLDTTWPTLAERFDAAGYRTGGFVANLEYCNTETGLARGFAHYEDYVVTPGQLALSSGLVRRLSSAAWLRRLAGTDQRLNRKDARQVNSALLRWLDRSAGRPFFAFLNYYDAHTPYYPPAQYARQFRTAGVPLNPSPDRELPPSRGQFSPAEVQGARDAYDGTIAYLDAQIGGLLDELERRRLLDRTLIVITSDHGEEFNEHGFMGHGNTLYREVVEVPLLMIYRGQLPVRVVDQPVSLRDLAATISGVASLDSAPFPGRSLASLWSSQPDSPIDTIRSELGRTPGKPAWLPSSQGSMASALYQNLRYIVNGDGTEELYDFGNDPAEQQNMIANPAWAAELGRFRAIVSGMRPATRR